MANRFDTIPAFNPFIQPAPLDLVAKVGMKKEEDYGIGVAKIQSYVDKVAGIDLIKDADKEYLQAQLGKLGEDIKKVSSQDFSNPNLQSGIGNLAYGIYNDPNIKNGYTGTQKVRAKQASIAELKKSKPELYNPSNEAYAMLDVTRWLNDGKAGTQLVDGHDYYNFYDTHKEIREAMKEFKPSKIKRTLPMQGHSEWMMEKSDESWSDSEVREYLSGVLSPQAKQQLKIDGVVAFAGRDDALLQTYYGGLKENLNNNNELIKAYQAKATVVDNDQRNIISKKIDSLQEQNVELARYLDKVDSQDLDFFNANKENIAGKLFTDETLKASTRAYSHIDIEEKYSPNEIWKTKFTQSMENSRANARMAFEGQQRGLDRDQTRDLKMLELGYKYYDSNGNLKDVNSKKAPYQGLEKASTNVGEASKVENGRDLYEKEVATIEAEKTEAYKKVRQSLIENDPNLASQYQKYVVSGGREYTANDPSAIATQEYLASQARKPIDKRDKWANEFIESMNSMNTRKAVLAQQKQQIDDEVTRNYGKDVAGLSEEYEKIKPLTVHIYDDRTGKSSDVDLNGRKLRKIFLDQTIKGKYDSKGDYIIPPTIPTGAWTMQIEGKKMEIYDSQLKNRYPQIYQAYQLSLRNGGAQAKAEQFRADLYNQTSLNLGDWWTPTGDKDPLVNQAVTYISNQLGGTDKEYKVARVNRTTGEIQFRIDPKMNADGKSSSPIDPKFAESLGYKYDKLNNTYTSKSLDYFKRDYTGFTPTEAELLRALDINTNLDRNTYSTPAHLWDPNGNGHYMRIVKNKGKDGNFKYWLRDENNNVLIDQVDFEDPISAIKAAKTYTADPERAAIIANSKK